jgi:flagellar hook-associated protein 1 FlgK
MSLDTAMQIASAGLANVSGQMSVISNNIANAATPDYAQETGTQTSLVSGGQGFGVFIGPVVREIDLQLQKETQQQGAVVSGLQAQQSALQGIDSVQGTPGAGTDLSSMLGNLQNAFTTLQSDPSSSASQTQVVNSASALCRQINTLSQSYTTARQNAQSDLQSGLGTLNSSMSTLASLTSQIIGLKASGQSTAALENQRDVAMNTMTSLVSMTFIQQPNGGLIASTNGGLSMTITQPMPQFSMAASVPSSQNFYPGGGIAPILLNGQDVTGQLTGGQIGADISLRDTVLPGYQSELDEFSNTLQSRFSAQGLQLFTPPSGGTTTTVPTPVQNGYIGYATSISVNPAVVANPAQVRDGNVTVAGSATGSAAFTPNPTGGPASFDGLISRVLTYGFGNQAQSGVAQTSPNVTGLGPRGNLAAPYAAPQTLSDFATDVVAAQSSDVSTTTDQLTTAQAVQTALQAQVTSVSGVNTDTQLSNLVGLQNSYGANARIIGAAQSMWTQLLNSVTV